jgi:hypothetical protein
MVRAFKKEVVPKLAPHVAQLGVKEAGHVGWRRYREVFPEMKVVLTARDPRDIYLSMYWRVKKGIATWSGPFRPESVATALNAEFGRQLEMVRKLDCFKARYEDICTGAESPTSASIAGRASRTPLCGRRQNACSI